MAQPSYRGGTLRVASTADTVEAIQLSQAEEAESIRLDQQSAEIVGLVGYLSGIWDTNRKHKEDSDTGVQGQMIANLQARNNQYSDEKKAEILAAGMPDVYMGLTNVKCAHAEAWLSDIFSSTDRAWGLQPTPVPDPSFAVKQLVEEFLDKKIQEFVDEGGEFDSPDDIIQAYEAAVPLAEEMVGIEMTLRAKAMEAKIHDQMLEGGWDEAFEDFLCDVVTSKAGIIKGPVIRRHKKIEWIPDARGNVRREVTEVLRPEFERVSPLDLYPSPDAVDVNDGSLIEKIKLSRSQLVALKEADGYDPKAIDEVLEEFPKLAKTVTSSFESDLDDLTNMDREEVEYTDFVEGLEYWCPVQGKTLIEHGLDKIPAIRKGVEIEPLGEYEINAIMVDSTLIYLDLNDHPLGHRPYSKTGWRKVPGSFWFKGVPELMEDLQRIINAAVRSLCYNMAIAAGPQVEVDTDRLVPGEDLEGSYPGKVWQTINRGNIGAPAVRFFNVNSNAQELFGIYENFAKLADDYTGIPAYAYGSDRVAGAGRTSSGLSMLMTSAAKGIKRVILGIDKDILKTVVRRQFDWNMQYLEDAKIKGDVDIVTTGAVGVMVKEQMSERRMNFLNVTANDTDMKLVGLEGRANVLREAASSLEMEGKKIVKTPQEIRDMMEADEKAGAERAELEKQVQEAEFKLRLEGAQLDNEAKRLQLQVEMAKMQLEQQKLQIEAAKLGIKEKEVELNTRKAMGDHMLKEQGLTIQAGAAEAAARAKEAETSVKVANEGMDFMERMLGGEAEDEDLAKAEAEVSVEEAKK